MKQSIVFAWGVRVLRVCVAVGVLLVGSIVGVLVPAASVSAAAAALTPVNPARFVDTRVGEQTVDGKFAGTGRIAGGTEFAITIAGRPGVPKDAAAVMMNVTAVRPDGPGHVTVYPCGSKEPNVSNINYAGGDVAPNAVLSKIGTKGQVCVVSLRGTDLIVDVNAFVPAGGTPVSINPVRNVDTRDAVKLGSTDNPGRLAAGKEYKFTIAGKTGVPPKAVAAMMNITAVRPDGPGFVTVYPCGTTRPIVSNINYAGGDVAPNAVLSKIGTKGQICVYSLRSTDLIIDVNGYVPAGGAPTPVNPVRYTDTRPGEKTIDGKDQGTGRLKGGTEHRFTIAGRPGVPKNAAAAMMNITAVRPSAAGHVTVYPCGTKRPIVSSINYRGGDVAPNAVLSKLGTGGQICIYSLAETDLIIDINGYVGPVRNTCVIGGKEVATSIPTKECDALIDLYDSTGGPNWTVTTGWNTPTDPCGWFGVECADGRVRRLLLSDNKLSGLIPNSIGSFAGLVGLSLSSNKLRGTVPSSIGSLQQLQFLSLGPNQLAGPVPESIGDLGELRKLYLGANAFTGTIPASLGNLHNLTVLDLGGNELTGSIPTQIADLSGLTVLLLESNKLTGALPANITGLTKLEAVVVSRNQLTGQLPTTLGDLDHLAYFDASYNALDGEIPATIANASKLSHLILSENALTGPIPDTIGELKNLYALRLDGNELSGRIPGSITDLTGLSYLALNDNRLTGPFPSSIASLSALKGLYLANNRLSGAIPPSIMQLSDLKLTLNGNRCFTARTAGLRAWLTARDPNWDDGC